MFARDVEMFIEHCENKGLATKTIGSYEQTLRLLMLWLDEQGITQTEKITHVVIQDYVKQIKERGKYTVTSNPNSGNYQERRIDFGKKVSDVTINNYLRNMSAFFNWCVEEGLILRSPVKRRDYIKVERRPLEFVSDEDFRKLLRNMNTASFSEYRDYIIIQLLLDTGMRINECLMIQVTDVNLPKRYIYLPAENTKGKKGRHVFFSDKMATQLQRWIKYKDRYRDSDFLFCTNKGKFLEVSNFEKNVRKYAQRIGLKDIQLAQNIGITFPYRIDNYCKIVCGMKHQGRYSDDMHIIHRSKEVLLKVLEGVKTITAEYGLILNEKKTHICKLSGEYRYLQMKYTLLQNGVVVRRIHPKAITRERRKLKAYKRLLDKGIITIEEIDGYFRSWLSGNYKYMSRDQIYKMNSLYVKLFGRSVTWKKGHGRLRWLMAHPSAA